MVVASTCLYAMTPDTPNNVFVVWYVPILDNSRMKKEAMRSLKGRDAMMPRSHSLTSSPTCVRRRRKHPLRELRRTVILFIFALLNIDPSPVTPPIAHYTVAQKCLDYTGINVCARTPRPHRFRRRSCFASPTTSRCSPGFRSSPLSQPSAHHDTSAHDERQ